MWLHSVSIYFSKFRRHLVFPPESVERRKEECGEEKSEEKQIVTECFTRKQLSL